VPSYVIPIWLILAAGSQPDPLSPPPHGRPVEASPLPNRADVSAGKPPAARADGAKPSAARPSAKGPGSAGKPGKTAASPEPSATIVVEPAEEIIGDVLPKGKGRKKTARKITSEDRGEPAERRTIWTSDRYTAVVPPGLTLAALRGQLGQSPTSDSTAPTSERSKSPEEILAEINKAREALRQETARLESLLKAAGSCGILPGAESLSAPTALSPLALREASAEQIDSVSKAMKGMKPEQAAALVSRLDRGLAAEILRRMKSADAGAILGILKPELAADLATEIATRRPMKRAASK